MCMNGRGARGSSDGWWLVAMVMVSSDGYG